MTGDGGEELIGGRYALGELLGVGGTGSVFAAVDRRTDGSVALKLLHPHLCDDEASRDAFLREASHVMALHHPNIVRVHAAGLHDAGGIVMPWIALELLEGPTLREWVAATGRLGVVDAAAVAEGMLAALGHAHAAGIVHRDISPQNVILHGVADCGAGLALTADMVRVVDFGLADVTGRATLAVDVPLTGGVRSVVGNAAYMSPEQAQGRAVRAVSDLYQAGAVLYYCLTGRAPFPRASDAHMVQAHVTAPPPVPSAVSPGARLWDRIVTRAMAKTPAHRYRDAAEFARAVRAAVAVLEPRVAPGVAEEEVARAAPPAMAEKKEIPESEATSATRVFAGGGPDGLDYLSPAARSAAFDAAEAPVRSNAGVAAGAVIVVVLALAGWAVAAAYGVPADPMATTSTEPRASAPSEEPPPAAVVTPTPAPTPTVVTPVGSATPVPIVAPALHGSVADVEDALRAAGLLLGTVTLVESPAPAGEVLAQNPAPHAAVARGSTIDVTVASGSNVVPQVAGMTASAARAQLEAAGFVVSGEPAVAASDPVTATQPGAGTVLRRGARVVLLVAVTTTPTPRPTVPTPLPTEDAP
ncbi:Serine/threonine protein kinase-related protein [Microbacterium laevaniformans OR221]|nr:Serine/threonine protein kinase-related protein [Microbacterium laevaniformans OR221]